MKKCTTLGLERCAACEGSLILCSVLWFKSRIEDVGFMGALKSVTGGDPQIYLVAAIKEYYPEYQKLLVLL